MNRELQEVWKKRTERMKAVEAEYNNEILKVSKRRTSVVTYKQITGPIDDTLGAKLAFYFPHDGKRFVINPQEGLKAASGRLPKDLWNFQILLFLDVDVLLSLEQTCKYFNIRLQPNSAQCSCA